jgi:response regulator RpfG family c-di-GMP phosphodiesterase
MPAKQTSELELWIWFAFLSAVLVLADALTPPCVNLNVLYVGLVLLSLWSTQRMFPYIAAMLSASLVLLGAFIMPPNGESLLVVLSNRLLVIVAIWGAATLCYLRRQSLATESRLLYERENAVHRSEELAVTAAVLREKNEQLAAVRDVAVYTLAKVAESRDMDTGLHLERICGYSLILADELRKQPEYCGVIDRQFMTNLRQSSPLHDIGKVSISDSILLKRGRLTPDEFDEMKHHASVGSDILQDIVEHRSEATFLKMATVVARYHHERFDGSGYPEGLAGKEIPLAARIVALADVYDALTSDRPYKDAYSSEMARGMIVNQSGLQFDPDIVEAFVRRYDDFVAVRDRYPAPEASGTNLAESLLAEYCGAEKEWSRETAFMNDFVTLIKAKSALPTLLGS